MTVSYYDSPLGRICMAGEDGALCGLWFEGQKYYRRGCEDAPEGRSVPEAIEWLDAYFAKKPLPELPKLMLRGTLFQKRVWDELLNIPYGGTVSYGEIAGKLECKSARAVGSAVGKNPVSIMIPCHRVLGADGSLTGYAGGIWRKTELLKQEGNT